MMNADIYHFADFTRANYRRLLRLAKETYVFRRFTDFKKGERFILWRHDLDASLQSARKLAEIEAEESVVTTYFLQLHSAFYNLLERENTDCIRDILSLGHALGLHFDCNYYNIISEEQLEKFLHREKRILEELFEREIQVFSFHNTTPFTQSCQHWQYAGLINAYAEYFQSVVGYCSDSHCYWRFRRLEDVLRQATDEQLQVLAHPECWQESVMSPKQRLWRCIDGRAEKTKQLIETSWRNAGRELVDWE